MYTSSNLADIFQGHLLTSPIRNRNGDVFRGLKTTFRIHSYRSFCFPGYFLNVRQKSSQISGAPAISSTRNSLCVFTTRPICFLPSIQLYAGRTRWFWTPPQKSRESSSSRRCRVADKHSSITRHNSSSSALVYSCICVGWP